tara:strand:- start:728 stop:1066 length:339 start_codon:yes stop_codon:yes gene_type:complete
MSSMIVPLAHPRPRWPGIASPLTAAASTLTFYLNQRRHLRDRALFDLAIDSKLQGCDLVQMKIGDLVSGARIRTRAIVMQQKTGRPVQFELLPDARASLLAWLERRGSTVDD